MINQAITLSEKNGLERSEKEGAVDGMKDEEKHYINLPSIRSHAMYHLSIGKSKETFHFGINGCN
jgi:hypothetical protein